MHDHIYFMNYIQGVLKMKIERSDVPQNAMFALILKLKSLAAGQ